MSDRNIDRLVKLAAKNLCASVREEPRILWDRIPLEFDSQSRVGIVKTNGDANSLVNGERWPLRITHLVLSMGGLYFGNQARELQVDPPLPIQMLENVSLRIRHHDTYYMAEQFLPAPSWMNKVTSVPNELGYAAASWAFDRPVILSARDQMIVDIQALFDSVRYEGATNAPFQALVSCSFTGVGEQSQVPYFYGAELTLVDGKPARFDPTNLQNVGMEPVALTDMMIQARIVAQGLEEAFINVPCDIRSFAIQIRQNGNGTNANWIGGPSVPVPMGRGNASLIGTQSGPAVVHQLPGDGFVLEPGEGLRFEAFPNGWTPYMAQNQENPVDFLLGMSGYLVVS